MNLSKNFTLEEFIYSDTAKKKKIDNSPNELHLKVMKHTCEYCLEILRSLLNEKYGKAYIKITSGYRSAKLNAAIPGSSNTSQHCKGEAADIVAYKFGKVKYTALTYTQLYSDIKQWVKEGRLSVDQCILEKSGNSTWVHLSHKAAGKTVDRRQFLKYNNGVYTLDRD